ncbi:MAG TPA: AAA family ATPase [Polyangiaceae bacterium]|nr:AAA family ATPase [Polyangiaceae bacterium]
MSRESGGRRTDVRLFGPFRLDVGEQRLWKGNDELKLRRKPFAILRFLTENPLRLATQEEVVDAVWGKIAMSESLLRTHMSEVRRLLGEGAIETVVGRGYRFLLEVEAEKLPTSMPRNVEAPATTASLVGRSEEMDFLRHVFETVLDQKRRVLFVTGDPGIGKTTLIDAFLAQIAAPQGAMIATGSCVEQFGTGEAYLPVLAALGAACRAPDGERIVDLLGRHAPTWLAQMPGLLADENLQALHLRIQGATQGRMLRELAEAFDVLAAERPLVLVLEDMQWSDRSTTDLVAILGARREPARVLVIVTCRQAELTKGDGLAKVIAELRARKQALTLHLETLSQTAVTDYLAQRFSNPRFPEGLAGTIHGMTGGNPLFTVAVVDDLESRGMIQHIDGAWELTAKVTEVASRRPDTVRQLIDIQIDRLSSNEQRILEAAGVFPAQFATGCVAQVLELPADEVDSLCEGLASEQRFLRFVSSEPWPDGTIQSLYGFAHALYRDAALARIPSATRRAWHRRVAEGMEAGYGERSEVVAGELAIHFDEAQVIRKAVRYYCLAGERAMRRFGRADALTQFNRARALLAKLPASDESDHAELAVLKHVGPAIIALQGTQDPLLEQTFARTAELARKLGDDRGLLAALLGRQRCHFVRGELPRVEDYEAEVAEVLARLADPVAFAEATVVAWSARLFRGQLAAARRPLTQACTALDAAESDAVRIVNAPVVGLWSGHVVVLTWLGGAPDEAMAFAGRMLARVGVLRDPFHLATALTITALAHMWRREPEKTLETARRALQVAREVGSPVWQGRAMSLHHWAATVLEPQTAKAHFEELSSSLSGLLGAGPYGRTAFTPCVAQVYAAAGHADRALRELDDALAFVEVSDERVWSSELHRLRGELLAANDPAEAQRAFTRALEISREQGARSFELRAALSLAKLDRGAKKRARLEDLRRVYASFAEGFETADLVEARALLADSR